MERRPTLKKLLLALSGLGSLALIIWAYLYSALPPWGLAIVGIVVFGLLCWATTQFLQLLLGLKTRAALDEESLAAEADRLSSKILALGGRHYAQIQKAWWADCENGKAGSRELHTDAVGRLVSEYSAEYEADVWKVITAADFIYGMDKSEMWRVQHGVRSDHDLQEIAQLMSRIAGRARYGKPAAALRAKEQPNEG